MAQQGSPSREHANRRYLQNSSVAEILDEMVTFLLCNKPADELDALVNFLEQKQLQQEQGKNGGGGTRKQQQQRQPQNNNGSTTTTASTASPRTVPCPPSAPKDGGRNAPRASSTSSSSAKVETATSSPPQQQQHISISVQQQQSVVPIDEGIEEDVFKTAHRFLNNDDELLHSLIAGGVFGPTAAANRLEEEFGFDLSTEGEAAAAAASGEHARNTRKLTAALAGLQHNETMLSSLLTLCINEHTANAAFEAARSSLRAKEEKLKAKRFSRAGQLEDESKKNTNNVNTSTSSSSYYFSGDTAKTSRSANDTKKVSEKDHQRDVNNIISSSISSSSKITPEDDKRLEDMFRCSPLGNLCSEIEKRIARSAAVRRCLLRRERIDDPAVRNIIFFVSCSTAEFNKPAASCSAEIDALLSELIGNGLSAVAAMEQQLDVVSRQQQQQHQSRVDHARSATVSVEEDEGEKLALWIQKANASVQVALKLRDRLRTTMGEVRLSTSVSPAALLSVGQKRDQSSDEDEEEGIKQRRKSGKAADVSQLLKSVSPHTLLTASASGEGCADDVMNLIRDYRSFIRTFNVEREYLL